MKDLGESLIRINEDAVMIPTKGETGTGDISEAVKHITKIKSETQEYKEKLTTDVLLEEKAKQLQVELLGTILEDGTLPVVHFAAGGVATPADVALLMQLGCEGIFVGSSMFKSSNPKKPVSLKQ